MVKVEEIIDAIESGDYVGFCLNCGEEHYNVEPDAENYTCEACGQNKVYGAEQILLAGY